jgi:hypothetical protein
MELLCSCAALASCGGPDPSEATDVSSTDVSSTGTPTTGTSTTGTPTSDPGATTTSTAAETTTAADTTAASTGTGSTTGPVGCTKNVVLMGYWPPTNEMLRPWSTDPTQNPDGWIGKNWGGHGYDVHAFFPEFPPDGDPNNDAIGDDGAVGSPDFDLRVDYQATSADFWRIVDMLQPVILVTTSRGGQIGWEVEAIEGGHGMNNNPDPAQDWASDKHGADLLPTEATIEARSWSAISTFRQGNTLPSQLPIDAIVAATSALGVTNVAVDQGTSGNFLSGFLGLHGLYYNSVTPHNVAAGHIHVGNGMPVADASALIEATLQAVLEQHPSDSVECP